MTRATSLAAFVVVSLAILGGMHAYLWARLVRDPGVEEPWRRLLAVLFVLLTLSVPIGMLALRLAPRPFDRLVPVAAFTWLGVAFLLFVSVLALDLARLAAQGLALAGEWLRTRPEAPPDPERRLLMAQALAGAAVAATAGASVIAFRSATGPAEVTETEVRLPRLAPALSGLTIVQVSDLHVGPTIGERHVRRLVDQIAALKPDLVAVTGDLVDGSVRELGPAVAHLGRLPSRYGTFFVTGNHEYYSGVDGWLAELRRLGVRVLRNERVAVGDAGASLDLAGVDDWSARGFGGGHGLDLGRALAGRDQDRALVLLAHQPRVDFVGEAVREGAGLVVSGHTHGGQIVPFNLLVRVPFPYLKGLYRHREGGQAGQVYVSRGTGYWGPPMRLGSPPEIAKLVLTA